MENNGTYDPGTSIILADSLLSLQSGEDLLLSINQLDLLSANLASITLFVWKSAHKTNVELGTNINTLGKKTNDTTSIN